MDHPDWTSIPPEIICLILENSSFKRAIRMGAVCKRWSSYTAADFSSQAWKTLLSPSQKAYCSLEQPQWVQYAKAFERTRQNMLEERCVVHEFPAVPEAYRMRASVGRNKVLLEIGAQRDEYRYLVNLSSFKSELCTSIYDVTYGYQILDSEDNTILVLDEKTGTSFNIDIHTGYRTPVRLVSGNNVFLANNDINYPSVISIDKHYRTARIVNLKERNICISSSMYYSDVYLQLHGKYFAHPIHEPPRIEVINTEAQLIVATLPRYEDKAAFALGDNRILYATQASSGIIGWRLIDFSGNLINEADWPNDINDASNEPCYVATVLANDMIAVGCNLSGRIHFINAKKNKELCRLRVPLDQHYLGRQAIPDCAPRFTCISPGRFLLRDRTCLKIIDFESQHILVKKSVVILKTDGSYESVRTSASELMKLAQEKIKQPQIRVYRIWETSTFKLSIIANSIDTVDTLNLRATKLYQRRKTNSVIPGMDSHIFGSEESTSGFGGLNSPPSKITGDAIVIKEELVNEQWRLADYVFTEKHFL